VSDRECQCAEKKHLSAMHYSAWCINSQCTRGMKVHGCHGSFWKRIGIMQCWIANDVVFDSYAGNAV
jgi:hypothetical protein